MIFRPLTDDELQTSFTITLDGIVEGRWGRCPSDTGLDDQTIAVLDLLARQPNPKTPSDILACRVEFGRMLDGTHKEEERQRNNETV